MGGPSSLGVITARMEIAQDYGEDGACTALCYADKARIMCKLIPGDCLFVWEDERAGKILCM